MKLVGIIHAFETNCFIIDPDLQDAGTHFLAGGLVSQPQKSKSKFVLAIEGIVNGNGGGLEEHCLLI